MTSTQRRDLATPIITGAYGIAIGAGVLLVGRAVMRRAAGGAGFTGKLKSVAGPHQVAFVVKNLHRPWLVGAASSASSQAHAATAELFGAGAHIDDLGDAFRHAFASGLLAGTAHERGMGPEAAQALARAAGHAHELDGAFNPNALSSLMDGDNNTVGAALRFLNGAADNGTPVSAEQLRERVLDAMAVGKLRVIEGDRLVPTTRHKPVVQQIR